MKADLIIISNAKSPEHRKMTSDAILSAMRSEQSHTFNIIVVEQQLRTSYQGVTTLHYDGPFHYNGCINIAMKYCKNKWVIWANNDLIFHQGWFSEIMEQYRKTGIKSWGSVSDTFKHQTNAIKEPEYQLGYRIGIEMSGWLITVRRDVWETIGGLGTEYNFHFSDYRYCEQLIDNNIHHALAVKSKVIHLLNSTFKGMDKSTQRHLSDENYILYEKICRERGYKYPQIYNPLKIKL